MDPEEFEQKCSEQLAISRPPVLFGASIPARVVARQDAAAPTDAEVLAA